MRAEEDAGCWSWHGLDRKPCAEHGPRVTLCSCGFIRRRGLIELPPADCDEVTLLRLWHRWGPLEREVYDYWLTLAKSCETEPLQAASLAARQVAYWREAGVLDWLAEGRAGSEDESLNSTELERKQTA